MAIEILEEAGPIPDALPLWRYMKLSSLFLLLDGTAFFPSIATLREDDPLEGDLRPEAPWLNSKLRELYGGEAWASLEAWLRANAEPWARSYFEANQSDPVQCAAFFADQYQRELRKRRAVWCWFAADSESAGMWSIYGQNEVAVQTTAGRLKKSLPEKRKFQISRIRYAERQGSSMLGFNPEVSADAVYTHRPHFVKGREYAHEQEVRVVTSCHDQEKGIAVRGIASEDLIQEVVLSPLLPHAEARAITKVLMKHAWRTRPIIRRSALLGSQPADDETRERLEIFFNDLGPSGESDLPLLIRSL